MPTTPGHDVPGASEPAGGRADDAPPLTRREWRDRQGRVTRPTAARTVTPSSRPTPRAASVRHRIGRKVLSLGALLCAGALALGLSVPANAFLSGDADEDAASLVSAAQSVDASSTLDAVADTTRSTYSIKSYAQIVAEKYRPLVTQWVPTTGSVRWPFPYAVGISSWFGPRKSPVPGTSSFHKGIDFTPGEGAPTYAIADGVVSMASLSPYGLGNEVMIEHEIDGVHITSVYGHLEMNSSPLKVGQTVKAGQMVGKTGSTGTVTGANMHLEIHVDEVPVDPYTWLKKNARD